MLPQKVLHCRHSGSPPTLLLPLLLLVLSAPESAVNGRGRRTSCERAAGATGTCAAPAAPAGAAALLKECDGAAAWPASADNDAAATL